MGAHPYLQNIVAKVEALKPGGRLDVLTMAYATRARLAAIPGFDEACYRLQIKLICDPMVPDPVPYRLWPYVDGVYVGTVIDLNFPESQAVQRLVIPRHGSSHLRLVMPLDS